MFANRYTAFADACVLAGALKRNLLLTLAEAEFFRLRWSVTVLDETERAITNILSQKAVEDAAVRAKRARAAMETAFEEACVVEFDDLLPVCSKLPDPKDQHVLAAAIKTQAATIVTENLKDFPNTVLSSFNIEARSADDFIADTIALNTGRAVAAISQMRQRFKKPVRTADDLLLDMEADGLIAVVDVLKPHAQSL